ncbi:MAG: hypothetical protein U1D30_04405 [Planctomycetota bacterium]
MAIRQCRATLTMFSMLLLAMTANARDDAADLPTRDLRAGDDVHRHYILHGPQKGKAPPEKGYGLLLVLPGGDGSISFSPFVQAIYANGIPEGYLVAQLVSHPWTPTQKVVWPTKKNNVPQSQFTTEDFVDSVIDDVAKREKIDGDRVFTLSWSSSGPACHAVALSNDKVKGSFIAMSVFHPRTLPPLTNSKGHAYYLFHSPQDRVCPHRFAEQASRELKTAGAKVQLTNYEGGHGWHGDIFGEIHAGIEWLEQNVSGNPTP